MFACAHLCVASELHTFARLEKLERLGLRADIVDRQDVAPNLRAQAAASVPHRWSRTYRAGDSVASNAGGPTGAASSSLFSSAESIDVTAVEELAIESRREMATLASESLPSDAGESSARDETGDEARTGSMAGRRGGAAMASDARCLAATTLAASTPLPDRETPTSKPRTIRSAGSGYRTSERTHRQACSQARRAIAWSRG